MNKSKKSDNNSSLLTFFTSKQLSTTIGDQVDIAYSSVKHKQEYSLSNLVWGSSEVGWCPAIIEKEVQSGLYNRRRSAGVEEWYLCFLTIPVSRSWHSQNKIYLFQVDKYPSMVDLDKVSSVTKSAISKATKMFLLSPEQRVSYLAEEVCTSLSHSEVKKYITFSYYSITSDSLAIAMRLQTLLVHSSVQHSGRG